MFVCISSKVCVRFVALGWFWMVFGLGFKVSLHSLEREFAYCMFLFGVFGWVFGIVFGFKVSLI